MTHHNVTIKNASEVRPVGGCACLPLFLGLCMCWAWWFGLPTPWGELNLDVFPPAIRLEPK